jgi:transcriptional regulator with XRE-family HTH domain
MKNRKKKTVPRMLDPRDVALGARIKVVRERVTPKVTQILLGQKIGVTTQQVYKYERGENRIAWSRLCDIAGALDISVQSLIAPLPKK